MTPVLGLVYGRLEMALDSQVDQTDNILLRDISEGVCTLTLNRPSKRNPLSDEMLAVLTEALEEIDKNATIKVVILAANGPAFSAGHDLNEVRAIADDYHKIHDLFQRCSQVMLGLTRLPQPVIAKVQGTATAAGCQLVASCDLVIAAETAQFATPGVKIGLFCSTPAVAISRTIGQKHAMEMLLSGDLFPATEAHRFGLVNKIVPLDELDAVVWETAKNISDRSSQTISMGKVGFYRQLDMDAEDAYAHTSDIMARNMAEHDAKEGIDAFLQKRRAVWRGR